MLKKSFEGPFIDTIKRWVKDTFTLNNIIDFSSCPAASMSKTKNIEVNIDGILKQGCWINRKNVFMYFDQVITEYALDDIGFKRIF